MTIVNRCKPIFERARVRLADLGFRKYDVLIRIVDWSGDRVGDGTPTRTDSPLEIQGRPVKVRDLTQQDIIASGGLYEDTDKRIGPFTPEYTGALSPNFPSGGINIDAFDPPTTGGSREVYFRITGPGLEEGHWFKKIATDTDRNWSYYFIVRKISTRDP